MQFTKANGELYDMSIPFILTMWAAYIGQMNGRPKADADSAQLVLKYMLENVRLVVRAWRKRLQHYSSASVFKVVGADLKEWVFRDPTKQVARKRMLRKMEPGPGEELEMFDLVGITSVCLYRPIHFSDNNNNNNNSWGVPFLTSCARKANRSLTLFYPRNISSRSQCGG